MTSERAQHIRNNPKYQQLVKTRNRFGWILSILMLIVYYGFILIIAFDKELFAAPMAQGMVTSVGVPAGFGVILFTIIITGIYVRRANREYDRLVSEIIDEEASS